MNLGIPLATALGGDKDHTVGTFHTIHRCGRGVLEHRDVCDGGNVNRAHLTLDTVHEDKRGTVVPGALGTDDDLGVLLARHT